MFKNEWRWGGLRKMHPQPKGQFPNVYVCNIVSLLYRILQGAVWKKSVMDKVDEFMESRVKN
jgi:hypothetical protein